VSAVAAIILAAGRGTRFGEEPKLLAPIGGKPLVRRVAEAAAVSAADPVIVVTGHHSEDVAAALQGLPVTIVHNARYADGLSTSVKTGFSALPPEAEAALVLLGDMPSVTAKLIDGLVSAWHDRGEPAAIVPTFEGQRGNPVLISRALEPLIHRLSGDTGAGPVLRGREDVVEWPTSDPAVVQDVDTREELARLRS